jgi:hypothetical protein
MRERHHGCGCLTLAVITGACAVAFFVLSLHPDDHKVSVEPAKYTPTADEMVWLMKGAPSVCLFQPDESKAQPQRRVPRAPVDLLKDPGIDLEGWERSRQEQAQLKEDKQAATMKIFHEELRRQGQVMNILLGLVACLGLLLAACFFLIAIMGRCIAAKAPSKCVADRSFLALLALLLLPTLSFAAPKVGGPVAPDGKTEVECDLPVSQRIKNIGSKLDGAGMCVFSSIEMALRWANMEDWRGWRDWCAAKYPGGGYPSKVDKLIADYARAKNIPVPKYINWEKKDDSILIAAMKTGRFVSVTYNGHDPHYSGTIAHMVCLVYYNPKTDLACILDNNFIGQDELVWMSCADFKQRWSGWAVVFLAPPPPPMPHN